MPLLRSFTGVGIALALVVACQRRPTPQPAGSGSAVAPPSAATSAPAASARVGETNVRWKPPGVGAVRLDTIDRTFEFGSAPRRVRREHEERRVSVLAAAEGKAQKVRVEYTAFQATEEPAAGAPTPDARAGKALEIELRDGQLGVRDAAGKAAPAPLAARVLADFVSLDAPLPLDSVLPDQPLRVGERLEPSHDFVLAVLPVDPDTDFDVAELALSLESTSGPLVRLALTTRFTATHGGERFELELRGPVELEAEGGRVRSSLLKGSAKLTTPGAEPKDGTVVLESRHRYE